MPKEMKFEDLLPGLERVFLGEYPVVHRNPQEPIASGETPKGKIVQDRGMALYAFYMDLSDQYSQTLNECPPSGERLAFKDRQENLALYAGLVSKLFWDHVLIELANPDLEGIRYDKLAVRMGWWIVIKNNISDL
jgi:hypothetical protein